MRFRRPLPDAIQNAPELMPGLEFYYRAFLELASTRALGYGCEGPIPYGSILQWAQLHGLTADEFDDLLFLILKLDDVYLKYRADKAKRDMERPQQ